MSSLPLSAFVGVGIALVGVFLTVIGVATTRSQRAFVRTAVETDAEVVGLSHRHIGSPARGTAGSGVWMPVVRFAVLDGSVVEATTRTGTNPPPAQPGQRVRVRYDPDDPTLVALASGVGSGALLGPLLVGIGVLVILVALVVAGVGLLLDDLG